MKRILFFSLLLLSFLASHSQETTFTLGGSPTQANKVKGRLYVDSALLIPVRDTNWTPLRRGALTKRPQDSLNNKIYQYIGPVVSGAKWVLPGASVAWGSITGLITDQIDLRDSLLNKANVNGSNAYGTWGISITGNSATVTNGVYVGDTANKWVGSIYRTPGIDSFYYKVGGTVYAIKDSTGVTDISGKLNISDTSAMLSPYLHSAGDLSPLFTTTEGSHNITFTQSSAAAYTLLGRGSGIGAYSFLASIDSNWIPTLHTEAYYNTKYYSITNPSGYITGNQTITLSGDVSGTGTTAITTTIGNDAVTFAKMQNISTQTFIGRNTAATGDPEELSIATAKTMLGLTGTNSGDQTINNTSDATSHTVTLSASGGSVQLIEGTNITLTTGGTGAAGTVTIASTGAGYTTMSQFVDETAWRMFYSNSLGDVTPFALGAVNTVLLGNGATSAPTWGTVGNSALTNSSITINGTSVSLGGTRTLTLASADFVNQGTTTTVLHGNAAGNPSWAAVSLTADVSGDLPFSSFVQGAANTVVTNPTASTADFTTTALSASNLLGRGSTGNIAAITVGGILSFSGTVLSATEVDGSTSNELQTLASTSDATSHTVTLSNSGGSFKLAEGSNITLTTTGTGLDGIITIASTGGGATVLDDLTDVTITSVLSGHFLRYNGSAWVNTTIQSGDLPTGSGNYIQNQTAGQQASSAFWVSSASRMDGTLTIGGTAASSTRLTVRTSTANEAVAYFLNENSASSTVMQLVNSSTPGSGYSVTLDMYNATGDNAKIAFQDVGAGAAWYSGNRALVIGTPAHVNFKINTNALDNNGIAIDTNGVTYIKYKLVLGSISSDPTGQNGMVYYNTTNNRTMGYTNSAWNEFLFNDYGSDATGDILYRNSSGYYTRLGIGNAADVLTVSGGLPIWSAPGGGSAHAMLSATHTDATIGTVARGDLITGQGASPTWTRLAKGSANQIFQSDGTDIGWVTVSGDITFSVGVATIGTDIVTYAKMQNVSATSRIMGRITAGAGDMEELTGTQATTLLDLFSTTTTTKGLVPGANNVGATYFLRADGTWAVPAGGGDMVLASTQTNTGAKTFLDATLLLRNVANTFSGKFTNTITADRTYTLQNASGTLAFLSDITGINSGTNTGDQSLANTSDATSHTVTLTGGTSVQFIEGSGITLTTGGTGGAGTVTIASTGSGFTNLTQFVSQTAWQLFYSNSLGDVVELALGGAGTYLQSNGAASAPTWVTPGGGGDMVLANVQSVTGLKTFDKDKLAMKGTSTGVTTISTANTSATNYTATLQAATGTIAYLSDIPTSEVPLTFESGLTRTTNTIRWNGVLTENVSITGATGTYSIDFGTPSDKLSAFGIYSAGQLFLQGNLQYSSASSGDADYTVLSGSPFIELVTITANRNLTLPSTGAGKYLIIRNKNTSGFSWNFVGTVLDPNGTTVTSFPSDKMTILVNDGVNWIIDNTGGGSGANTALSNLASVSINTSLIPQTGVDLGAAATAFRDLYLYGAGTFSSTSLKLTGTPTAARTITFLDASYTVARQDAAQTFTGVQTFTNAPTLSTATVTVSGNTITFPTSTSTLATLSLTETFTNKRINPRVTTIASNATWSPSADNEDIYKVTAQAVAVTTISNPTGTPVDGQIYTFKVKDNATARALTWSGTQWRAGTNLALPTTTTLSKWMIIRFMWNSDDSKWDLIAVIDGI